MKMNQSEYNIGGFVRRPKISSTHLNNELLSNYNDDVIFVSETMIEFDSSRQSRRQGPRHHFQAVDDLRNIKSECTTVPCSSGSVPSENCIKNTNGTQNNYSCATLSSQQYDDLIKSLNRLNEEVKSLAEMFEQKSRQIESGTYEAASSSSDSGSSEFRERHRKRQRISNDLCSKRYSRLTSCSTGVLNYNCHLRKIREYIRNDLNSEPNTVEIEKNESDTISDTQHTVNQNLSTPSKRVHFGVKTKENHDVPFTKNTDKSLYFNSENAKFCRICKDYFAFIVIHYKTSHPNCEVLVSRISPEMAKKARNDDQMVLRHNMMSCVDAICYFCEEPHQKRVSQWIDHIRCCTGEYAYECSVCKKRCSSNRWFCCGRKLIQKFEFDLNYNDFTAFICQMCNYVQISEENICKHLITEHGLEDIYGQYQQIILLPSLARNYSI